MGIKDFFKIKLTKGKCMDDIGTVVSLKQLKGETICIDASYIIYSSLLALSHVKALSDKAGKPTGHINAVIQKVIMYKKHGIRQIWVFDNPEPNKLKEEEQKKRAERREKAKDNRAKFRMTAEHVQDVIKILTLIGVPYIIVRPGIEAEQYGSILCTGPQPLCSMMLSGDSDIILFGGVLLRPVVKRSATGKSKKTIYKKYELCDVLTATELTREQLVTAGIALGSDFAPKTPRIGPRTVIERAKQGIELTEAQSKARDYFLANVEMNCDDLQIHESDFDKLSEYLTSRGFNSARIGKFKTALLKFAL